MTEPKLRLQEGLDKLKKLDPKTYRIFDISQGQVMRMSALKEELRSYILRGVIQDAIAARGWGCYQYHYRRDALPEGTKREFAYISTDTDTFASAEADTPAEAILLAFVAALGA